MAASVGMRLIRRMHERSRDAGSAMSLACGSKADSAPTTPTCATEEEEIGSFTRASLTPSYTGSMAVALRRHQTSMCRLWRIWLHCRQSASRADRVHDGT